jgi:hypothetical protein
MESFAMALRDLRAVPGEAPEPRLGFYNRVASTIVDNQRREAWGLFSPGAAFFRRIAFASLLVLASLGSFLITRESAAGGVDAAAIMAQHDSRNAQYEPAGPAPSDDDRDRLLVTLASYHE